MIDFYAGLAAFKQISYFHKKVCLAGIDNNSYALGDIPFESDNINGIIDSGAFQDVTKNKRLPFEMALKRQLRIATLAKINPQYIVTYDFLVDEKYIGDGKKIKERVDYETANFYVEETIKAAKFYSENYNSNLIISTQGITPEQYYECACKVLEYAKSSDCFGLGGFCILGLKKRLIPSALLTFQKVLPLVKEAGLKKVHIFGVTTLDILYILGGMCYNLNLDLSTDSTSMARAARFGEMLDIKTGRRIKVGNGVVNNPGLAITNVLSFQYILNDIRNRYIYRGKQSWLSAIDFEFNVEYQLPLF